MRKIAVFGKGGIGKSTLTSNLAAAYAARGLRVLLVGCDPKHDTTVALTEGDPIRTAVEHSAFMDSSGGATAGLVVRGRLGVDCVEAGGPEPGIGCAGRGISRMVEILTDAGYLREDRYDVALFDVLGDVVCGGFAAPLREGLADVVVIATSEELMSLYAANNVARAVRNYAANGPRLAGLVANLRDQDADRDVVARFAALLGTRVAAWLPRDPAVRRAEYARRTAFETAPQSPFALAVVALADELLRPASPPEPTPLTDAAFQELARVGFAGEAPAAAMSVPAAAAARAPAATAEDPARLRAADRRREKRHDLLTAALARLAAPRETGSNAEQWGAADEWRRFFCDRESRRNAPTGLDLRAPVLQVQHQDMECSYATPDWAREGRCFYAFPWKRFAEARALRDGRGDGGPGAMMTDLRDLDVIRGGEGKLRAALAAALAQAGGLQAVVVHSTCVPTVIGDDVEKAMKAARGDATVPLIYDNPAGNRAADVVGAVLARALAGAEAVAPRPNTVNLVGFAPGAPRDELRALVEAAGVAVNACVVPSLTLEEARGLPLAAEQVLLPNAAYEPVYASLFPPPLPAGRAFDPPYGVEGTRRWLRGVAGLFGAEDRAESAFARGFAPLAGRWDELRRRARGHTLGFVADGAQLARLSDARLMWGVPLLRVLREMGFAVEVLVHGAEDRGPVRGFKTPEELERLLAGGAAQAYYSEYSCDERLLRAGRGRFDLSVFEPGLAGAVASLERLLTVVEWDFARRYAAPLSGRAS